MKALSLLALAAMGIAGAAQAQTIYGAGTAGKAPAAQPMPSQAMAPTGPDGFFKDEYGFRYNSRGDRVDARGRIMSPPVTPRGARALK